MQKNIGFKEKEIHINVWLFHISIVVPLYDNSLHQSQGRKKISKIVLLRQFITILSSETATRVVL